MWLIYIQHNLNYFLSKVFKKELLVSFPGVSQTVADVGRPLPRYSGFENCFTTIFCWTWNSGKISHISNFPYLFALCLLSVTILRLRVNTEQSILERELKKPKASLLAKLESLPISSLSKKNSSFQLVRRSPDFNESQKDSTSKNVSVLEDLWLYSKVFKVHSSLNGSVVSGLLDDEFDCCMQAGIRFLPTFSFVCCAQAVFCISLLYPATREAGSPTSWLSYFMWSGALIMLDCYYRLFWNTPESRNMDRIGYFSGSALQIPFCSELTSKATIWFCFTVC